jgi:hypothetical protein
MVCSDLFGVLIINEFMYSVTISLFTVDMLSLLAKPSKNNLAFVMLRPLTEILSPVNNIHRFVYKSI